MRLAIVGPGLIGHSITLAARRADPAVHVVEIDRDEPLDALRDVHLVALATPVDGILACIRDHAELLRAPVVIDTGSTKQAIVHAARAAGLTRFIGGHPMAGGTISGASGARADLFDGRRWFLVSHGADAQALQVASSFVTSLGAVPTVLEGDGTEHDRVMAAVSHLPQAVASVLMSVAAAAAGDELGWAGGGLRDTTRLAASSPDVWASIFATNASQLSPMLREAAAELSHLAERLDDAEAVRDLFVRAQRARATLEE